VAEAPTSESGAELAGASILARVEAALVAASEAVSRVLRAEDADHMELLRAAVLALAEAESAATEARAAINAAKGGRDT
jgi:hypothetical protein